MKVMLFVKATKQMEADEKPSEEALTAMHKYNEELQKAGVLLDLGGLTPINQGVRMKFTKSKRTVLDGPFTESKEVIAGYSLLEVRDLAEAVEWAKRAPFSLTVRDGEEVEVEIRPLFDPSEFDPPQRGQA